MPFQFPSPIKTEQGEFPFAALTLVVSPSFTVSGVEAQIVLKAQPYDIRNGVVVQPTASCVTVDEDGKEHTIDAVDSAFDRGVVFSAGYAEAARNPALAKALIAMSAALQEFVLVKLGGK